MMNNRGFRVISLLVITGMLVAMTVVTAFSASAFEPLDGEESSGNKTTIGPLDSREESVGQELSYPDDYYSAVTYAPLDGPESEDEQSDVSTDSSQSETAPSESSKTKPSNTNTSYQKPTATSASESSQPGVIPTEPVSSGGETGGEPTVTTVPIIPTLPSQTSPSESTKTPLYGDANDDGAVNMKDVLLMRKYMAEMPVTVCFENADVDVSGTVNMKDVLAVRKFLAEIIDKLGPDA